MIGKTPGGSGVGRRRGRQARPGRHNYGRHGSGGTTGGSGGDDEVRAQEPVIGAAGDAAAEQIIVEGARPQFARRKARTPQGRSSPH